MTEPITEETWVEAAALAIMRQSEGADSTWDQFGHEGRDYWHGLARAAWPLVASPEVRAAILAPILALHRPDANGYTTCAECDDPEGDRYTPWPCPTALAAGVVPDRRDEAAPSKEDR